MDARARGLEQLSPIPQLHRSWCSDEWGHTEVTVSENAKCFVLAHRSTQTKVNATDMQKKSVEENSSHQGRN